MRRLVYASFSDADVQLPDLLALLSHARKSNQRDDITGLLLYHDRFFLQLIEGPSDAITSLLKKLRADKRHRRVTLLSDQQDVSGRIFGQWQMGFYHLASIEPLSPEGLVSNRDDMIDAIPSAAHGDPGGSIMAEFYRTHRIAG